MGEKASRAERPSPDGEPGPKGISGVSRRAVLRAGGLGAAAVGAVSAFPALFGELVTAAPEVPAGAAEAPAVAGEAEAVASLEGPIVAHIRDAATGDISLYVGEREIVYRDPGLVHQLARATR